jgi:hypothetical protein
MPTSMRFGFQGDGGDWYKQLADHLLRGAPLDVRPEQARRVIAIIEAAGRSSQSGRPEPVAHEESIDPSERWN